MDAVAPKKRMNAQVLRLLCYLKASIESPLVRAPHYTIRKGVTYHYGFRGRLAQWYKAP